MKMGTDWPLMAIKCSFTPPQDQSKSAESILCRFSHREDGFDMLSIASFQMHLGHLIVVVA